MRTHREASNYVNVLLEERIRALGRPSNPASVLDLGCGVGGTLLHLAAAFPGSRLTGVTISERQIRIAERLAARRGLGGRCRFERADFLTMRLATRADVALAVESFVHAAHVPAFFRTVAAHLRPGGHLLLVDDFLQREEQALSSRERDRVEAFRRGWRAPAVRTAESCAAAAADVGLELVGGIDLTPLIRLGRPRDRVIARLSPLFGRLGLADIPFFGNMIGGDALHGGLETGTFGYRLLTFRLRRPATDAEIAPPDRA